MERTHVHAQPDTGVTWERPTGVVREGHTEVHTGVYRCYNVPVSGRAV